MSKKHYQLRIPRSANGIRAQESRAGLISGSWWAKDWRKAIEGMGLGVRLGRGRNYAMSGQVITIELEGSHVAAKIVGTRSDPYQVSLDFREPDSSAHNRIVKAIRKEPILVARLLADDLPLEIVEIFKQEGFSLFPGGKLGPKLYDMTTHCSCPDYANPCKHTTAVLILLGEEVARRPLTLLELRGIMVEELCDED